MLEKVSRLAERAATNVSRRQMLGRFGYAAAAAVAALAGVFPSRVHAARGTKRPKPCIHCTYACPDGSRIVITRQGGGCPGNHNECRLVDSFACDQPGP